MYAAAALSLIIFMSLELEKASSDIHRLGSCYLIYVTAAQPHDASLELQTCQAMVSSISTKSRTDMRRSTSPCLDQLSDNCRMEINLNKAADKSPCNDSWDSNLQHYFSYSSETFYTITIEWDPYPGAKFYSVVAALLENDASEGCKATTNGTSVNFKLQYLGQTSSDIAVKVAPEGHCVASRKLIDMTPENCFYLCSMCSCLDDYTHALMEGPNILETCISAETENSTTIRVTWEQGEDYLKTNSDMTFHLTIYNGDVLLLTVEVKGQTSASLQFRALNKTKIYDIEITEIVCMGEVWGEKSSISFNYCPTPPSTLPPRNCSKLTKTSNNFISTPHPSRTMIYTTSTSVVKQPSVNRPPTSERYSQHDNGTSNILEKSTTTKSFATSLSPANLSQASKLYTISSYRSSSSTTIPNDAHWTTSTITTYYTNTYHTPWIVVLTVVTIAVFAIFLITIFTTMRKYHFHWSRDHHNKAITAEDGTEKTVLVLFSQASSIKDELSVMEHVVKALSVYGVHCLYFDKPSVRTSVAEWVEGSIKRSDKVLLVVNKEFVMEWDSPKAYLPHGESLVYVARQVVHSFVMRDKQQLSKFALVFLRKEDQRDLLKDSLYLQSLKSYLVQPQALGELEGLVRFILDVPTYILSINHC